ncbi:MAG: prolipoprotein diacylglyceryl transferase [Alphaproteobacteria bacterium]|jgi:phosphatidylglycerol:prolipoprotein diacylglycerol transferase
MFSVFSAFPALALPFPTIDPIIVSFGPFAIRWYALAYVAGLLIGWWMLIRIAEKPPAPDQPAVINRLAVDDFLLWATLGIILGGRMGYVLFYQGSYYLDDPLRILAVWQGGMSFHGGLIGVVLSGMWFCRRRTIPALALGDLLALVAPLGIFFGRIANFINGELFGRITDVPWAVVFPRGGALPRHPSQLYEAGLEGILLFAILWGLHFFCAARARRGFLTGAFLLGYGIFRIGSEFFREPDAHLGFITGGTTMGQWLSLPVAIIGAWLIFKAFNPGGQKAR